MSKLKRKVAVVESVFLTVKDVADLFQVDRSTVYNWMYYAGLPSMRVGRRSRRFERSQIEAWAKSREG
ncbi:helix-turn-helix domain-containing protein [Ktedonobacter racemifer]|uniref:Phage transcriptional regulator, AlpA n=1 Tax=Ktedonobacter racemifer DSM 44963 TaxID=485913 RepID=D6TIT2_KTERA|nr:helix-turn-helix domain-containing protein [Ktedonobacter racemifer]EFH89339.1 phage transcriptional regulator, AlpA [Ktedonobacter racemifer DSM 44963]